jgi:CIC family chloride channel protein
LIISDDLNLKVVPLQSNLRGLVEAVAHSKRNIFPVVDAQGNLAGIIALENIREIMFDSAKYDTLRVDQLMQKPIVVANLNDDMSLIMEKFDKSGVWNIPVVADGKYVGFISKSSVFTNYRNKLRQE